MALDPEIIKQLIETFKSELDEQALIITTGLIELERQPEVAERERAITSIFRAAHNIKGASRGLGINQVGEIAHHIESLFSLIQKKTISITPKIIDLCLDAVDKMKIAMQSYVEQKPLPFNIEKFLENLDKKESSASQDSEIQKTASSEVDEKIEKEVPKNDSPEKPLQEDKSLKINQLISKPDNYLDEMVRVSVKNIERISALIEEMQVSKIAIDDHYHELTKLLQKTKHFSEAFSQIFYFLKIQLEKNPGDNLQKLISNSADSMTEITNASINIHKNLHSQINSLEVLSNSLQEEIRTLRLVPMGNLLHTMPRYVRDLSHELNKKVDLKIIGEEVKIDKMILESLKDPIIHILRNSIDHGIESPEVRKQKGKPETGLITIRIQEESGQIGICISDDGGGIDIEKVLQIALKKNLITPNDINNLSDEEKIELIFKPGFSTKEIITSISGRGVGLDVVKENIGNINGTVEIQTEKDKNTIFNLRVPLTLASARGLLVTSALQSFVIPISAIQRVLTIKADEVINIEGTQAIHFENNPVSLHSLNDILNLEQKDFPHLDNLSVIVLKKAWNTIAILVDEIIGEREIVIKALQPPLSKIPGIAGGTLTGSNKVILVLDPNSLITEALQVSKSRKISFEKNKKEVSVAKPHILVVDDSITTRTLEKNILESRNYKVTVAVNGKEAWDLLQTQKFSLVISDVVMPVMDGFTLTERIKQNDKLRETPVIIVTSLGSESEKKRGIDVGANAYIVKNEFESGALLEIVEQMV